MRTVFCMAILVIGVGSTDALTVRLQNAGQSGPQEIEYVNGSGLPLEFVLELANETISDTPPILTWQLELGLSGVASAVGELEFSSVAAPDGSLFGDDPGPISLTDLPTNEMVVSDADPSPEFTGVIIPAESPRRLQSLLYCRLAMRRACFHCRWPHSTWLISTIRRIGWTRSVFSQCRLITRL